MKNSTYPKTYGRKRGRRKKLSIDNYKNTVKKHMFSTIPNNKDIIIEIGSGNGENIINLSNLYPNKLIIACEVYIDGNVSLLSKLEKSKINNVKIFGETCFFLFEKMKKNSIQEIWILYPDPWPKRRHYKRKLINKQFIKTLNYFLKKDGKVYIATDDSYYFIDFLLKFYNSKLFKWENDRPLSWLKPFRRMIKTSLFIKAQKNGQKSNFMIFSKKI